MFTFYVHLHLCPFPYHSEIFYSCNLALMLVQMNLLVHILKQQLIANKPIKCCCSPVKPTAHAKVAAPLLTSQSNAVATTVEIGAHTKETTHSLITQSNVIAGSAMKRTKNKKGSQSKKLIKE